MLLLNTIKGGDGGMQLAEESLPSQNRIQRIWEAFPRIFYLFHLLTLGLFWEQDESPQWHNLTTVLTIGCGVQQMFTSTVAEMLTAMSV